MIVKNTKINGFYKIDIPVHTDERGSFEQWFSGDSYESIFNGFKPVQANTSISKKGVIRGIHYSTAPEGQAKVIICVSGKIRDFAVDLRKNSDTFGKYDVVELEGGSGKVSFIDEGLGHAFEVISESATVVYLLSSPYSKTFEKEINPLDPKIGIDWLTKNPTMSDKDKNAPMLNTLTDGI